MSVTPQSSPRPVALALSQVVRAALDQRAPSPELRAALARYLDETQHPLRLTTEEPRP